MSKRRPCLPSTDDDRVERLHLDLPVSLAISGPVPEFLQHDLQKVLYIWRARLRRDADSGADHLCNSSATLLPGLCRNLQPSGKEGLDQLGLLRAEIDRLREAEFGPLRRVEEKAGGAVRTLMHHQRPGHEVTQAPVLGVEKHRHHSHTVRRRHKVHNSYQVAGDSLKRVDGTASVFDHPNSSPAFARRLPFPEDLKERVITDVDKPKHKNSYRPHPDGRALAECQSRSSQNAAAEENQQQDHELDHRI